MNPQTALNANAMMMMVVMPMCLVFLYNITRKLFEYCLGVKIFVADLLVWLYMVCIDKRNIRMKYNMWCCDALY